MIGGLAILLGVFVPIVSLPMAIVLLTALFTVHLPYGFFSVKLAEVTASGIKFGPVGYEIILLYLAGLLSLAIGGAGPLSIDRWLCTNRNRISRRLEPDLHGQVIGL
jgi:putative oxidoreductase